MARSLNKNRMFFSRIIIVCALILTFTTRQIDHEESLTHALFDFSGYIMIVICGMGRLYTTAFLGGRKNKDLITYGPFSVVRNPLYVCSWFGFTGFALFSNNLWVILFVPVSFFVMYFFLVRREEEFLIETFGDTYRNYCDRVPWFIPRYSGFTQPDEIHMTSQHYLKGLLDNVWWFIVPPVFEFLEFFVQ
jgi:protein-S-isoprenylcysteine O-methyltransferase Ste14